MGAMELEDLVMLKEAEQLADAVWQVVSRWEPFARDTVGQQLVRAVDSIGANIAEAFGRFHYGERLQFLYYARGSLYESKYWLNRARQRQLLPAAMQFTDQITSLARMLNAFASSTKRQRTKASERSTIREASAPYTTDVIEELTTSPLFTATDLAYLSASPETQQTTSKPDASVTNF